MLSPCEDIQLIGPRTPMPPRSVLVGIKALGLGTAYRESLSSYFQRLADTHSLTPQVLAREVVFQDLTQQAPNKTHHFEDAWRLPSFNGLATQDSGWVIRLGTLTAQWGLEYLTLGFLSPYISSRGLVTKHAKWCPMCLKEGMEAGTPYAQLLWSFKSVTCCPKHQLNLVTSCGCPHIEWMPSGRVKNLPHVCPRCAGPLGRVDHPKATKPSPKKLLHATLVAGLLTSDLAKQVNHPDRGLLEFLKGVVQAHHEGCATRLAGLLGVTKGTLSGWISGIHRPEFSRILQLAEMHGCSLEDVFSGRSDRAQAPCAASKADSRIPDRRNPGDINWKKVVRQLNEALVAAQPVPLSDVAAKIGVSADTLRHRELELCQALSSRWLNWRKVFRMEQNLAYGEQVRMEAMRLANRGVRPSWQRILEAGVPRIPIWRWRTFVQTICDEVWESVLDTRQIA